MLTTNQKLRYHYLRNQGYTATRAYRAAKAAIGATRERPGRASRDDLNFCRVRASHQA